MNFFKKTSANMMLCLFVFLLFQQNIQTAQKIEAQKKAAAAKAKTATKPAIAKAPAKVLPKKAAAPLTKAQLAAKIKALKARPPLKKITSKVPVNYNDLAQEVYTAMNYKNGKAAGKLDVNGTLGQVIIGNTKKPSLAQLNIKTGQFNIAPTNIRDVIKKYELLTRLNFIDTNKLKTALCAADQKYFSTLNANVLAKFYGQLDINSKNAETSRWSKVYQAACPDNYKKVIAKLPKVVPSTKVIPATKETIAPPASIKKGVSTPAPITPAVPTVAPTTPTKTADVAPVPEAVTKKQEISNILYSAVLKKDTNADNSFTGAIKQAYKQGLTKEKDAFCSYFGGATGKYLFAQNPGPEADQKWFNGDGGTDYVSLKQLCPDKYTDFVVAPPKTQAQEKAAPTIVPKPVEKIVPPVLTDDDIRNKILAIFAQAPDFANAVSQVAAQDLLKNKSIFCSIAGGPEGANLYKKKAGDAALYSGSGANSFKTLCPNEFGQVQLPNIFASANNFGDAIQKSVAAGFATGPNFCQIAGGKIGQELFIAKGAGDAKWYSDTSNAQSFANLCPDYYNNFDLFNTSNTFAAAISSAQDSDTNLTQNKQAFCAVSGGPIGQKLLNSNPGSGVWYNGSVPAPKKSFTQFCSGCSSADQVGGCPEANDPTSPICTEIIDSKGNCLPCNGPTYSEMGTFLQNYNLALQYLNTYLNAQSVFNKLAQQFSSNKYKFGILSDQQAGVKQAMANLQPPFDKVILDGPKEYTCEECLTQPTAIDDPNSCYNKLIVTGSLTGQAAQIPADCQSIMQSIPQAAATLAQAQTALVNFLATNSSCAKLNMQNIKSTTQTIGTIKVQVYNPFPLDEINNIIKRMKNTYDKWAAKCNKCMTLAQQDQLATQKAAQDAQFAQSIEAQQCDTNLVRTDELNTISTLSNFLNDNKSCKNKWNTIKWDVDNYNKYSAEDQLCARMRYAYDHPACVSQVKQKQILDEQKATQKEQAQFQQTMAYVQAGLGTGSILLMGGLLGGPLLYKAFSGGGAGAAADAALEDRLANLEGRYDFPDVPTRVLGGEAPQATGGLGGAKIEEEYFTPTGAGAVVAEPPAAAAAAAAASGSPDLSAPAPAPSGVVGEVGTVEPVGVISKADEPFAFIGAPGDVPTLDLGIPNPALQPVTVTDPADALKQLESLDKELEALKAEKLKLDPEYAEELEALEAESTADATSVASTATEAEELTGLAGWGF